jgi:tetratricopeptide (TPR) repeat protein
MKRVSGVAILVLTVLSQLAPAQGPKPLPTDPVSGAIDHYRNLEYDPAQATVEGFLKSHPDDLRGLNTLASIVLYREMFQRGLLDSHLYGKEGEAFQPATEPVSAEFERRLYGVLDKAQALADQRVHRDPADEGAQYWGGVTHATRATYLFTVKRSWFAALSDAKAADRQHAELLKRDPNFVDANLVVGAQDYVVGALPWILKPVASLVGVHGDRDGGLKKLELVAAKGKYARLDAITLLSVLYQREERWADARKMLERLAPQHPHGFLAAQELAGVCTHLQDYRCAASTYDLLLDRYRAGPPNASWKRFWAAKALFLAGQSHEKLGENELAMKRYDEASRLKGDDRYVRKAELAHADLLRR